NTHFTNPHGLSDENHYTTARELAIITAEAMKYPLFCEISGTKTVKVRYDGIENGRLLINHNKLLKTYNGATGGKTGYTKKDGKCLVSSAERDGLEIIAVTLGDSSPTSTHTILLDSAFEDFQKTEIVSKGELRSEIPAANSENTVLSVTNEKGASVCLPKGARFDIELQIPKSITAPIKKGEIIGKAVCRYGGERIYIINIISIENINLKRKSFFERIFEKQ
ncbi:MAG: D-alanyl-D-alanine carboxypeptidase, partial [Clostridia bacterium]|nr:D-alanyl-D-alanine carboxypeptidase [Clostridia bacterium]